MVTVCGMCLWPVEQLAGQRAVYSSLRGIVQIVNWALMFGVAYEICYAAAAAREFLQACRVVNAAAIILCAYGIYQAAAIPRGWPSTGIRRPIAGISASTTGEQQAAFVVQGQTIYRPGSLLGEPKTLGGACITWIAFALGRAFTGRVTGIGLCSIGLFILTLFLTASTSAWGAALVSMLVFVYAVPPQRRTQVFIWGGIMWGLLMTSGSFDIVGAYRVADSITVSDVIVERTVSRIEDSGVLEDLPEQYALSVLRSDYWKTVFGVGLGGMSFYIAQELPFASEYILFPNNGLLGWICNVGIVGLVLLLLTVAPGVSVLQTGCRDTYRRGLAFVGTVVLLQCLIHGGYFMWSIALGLLFAAAMLSDSDCVNLS
ncbi:MAG: hypothetical protein IT168_12870 [Bryobacterales bacterium]|nr:hypothetical protein [Bryobacterales bacterium]